jgi:hypothetical protein
MDEKLIGEVIAVEEKPQFLRLLQKFDLFKQSIQAYIRGELHRQDQINEDNDGSLLFAIESSSDRKIEIILEQYRSHFFMFPQAPLRLLIDSLVASDEISNEFSPQVIRNVLKLIRQFRLLSPKFLIPPVSNSIVFDLKKTTWMKGGFSALFSGIQFEEIVRLCHLA